MTLRPPPIRSLTEITAREYAVWCRPVELRRMR